MADYKLRDRDSIISKEGIIFRVYGCWHPPRSYVCDAEYAPSTIYKSEDPRAIRTNGNTTHYKFYEHDGLKFVEKNFPQYRIYYKPLQEWLIGINHNNISSVKYPIIELQKLITKEPKDELTQTISVVLDLITSRSNLKAKNFGVFGSLLQGFYHPKYSDIDFTINGRRELHELLEVLEAIQSEEETGLVNEFGENSRWSKRSWKSKKLSLDEYGWYQKRKLIYNIYVGKNSSRPIKIEFEPVKKLSEMVNEYNSQMKIQSLGIVEAYGTVINDKDSYYIPAVYDVEIDSISGFEKGHIKRIVSYVEEYRMQVRKGEKIYVVGNLEKVTTSKETFNQIVLTYCPQYYNQVLKVAKKGK